MQVKNCDLRKKWVPYEHFYYVLWHSGECTRTWSGLVVPFHWNGAERHVLRLWKSLRDPSVLLVIVCYKLHEQNKLSSSPDSTIICLKNYLRSYCWIVYGGLVSRMCASMNARVRLTPLKGGACRAKPVWNRPQNLNSTKSTLLQCSLESNNLLGFPMDLQILQSSSYQRFSSFNVWLGEITSYKNCTTRCNKQHVWVNLTL